MTKEDSSELAQQIKSKIKECTAQKQKLLNSTILLFRTRNISEEDINEYFADTTDSEPVYANKISTLVISTLGCLVLGKHRTHAFWQIWSI